MKTEIIQDLLKIDAVQINPVKYFTWTSGVKSPIYCDNRLIMSYPHIRKKITKGFVQLMDENNWQADVIAGCATAGIPHAAWLSDSLDLPMVYVRSKPKSHGKENQIEGKITPGEKVLVIEDLISTGGSSITAANALKEAGADVVGVLAIFSYGLRKAKENFHEADIPFATLTNFDELVTSLIASGELTEDEKADMLHWRHSL